jgi:signal peptidase I
MRTAISAQRLRWLLLALGLVLAARQWLWTPVLITGESMQPTLRGGQLVALNKLAYLFGRPQRGEVVGVWTGSGLMVKRVLGLPGETIALRDGMFYVNGAPVAEPYVQFHDVSTIAPGQLGPDRFVVAGDNRSKTIIAVVNRDRIVGRVMRKRSRLREPSMPGCQAIGFFVSYRRTDQDNYSLQLIYRGKFATVEEAR